MLDYLVVGLGLAGISFCDILEDNSKTFHVVSDNSQQASLVAGGLYNPVVLKRFTLAWKVREQMALALPLYRFLEEKLEVKLDHRIPILRRFASTEEQNLWFEAADKPHLGHFLCTDIQENKNPLINAPFGFGQVQCTGRIDVRTLIGAYAKYISEKGLLKKESFDFGSLEIHPAYVQYKSERARNIVFAEGFGLKNNPFFNYLPLNGTKGELLTIKAPGLKEGAVIKSSVFSIPLGNDLYRIGATYKWNDKTNDPTEASKNELLTKLRAFLKCDFEMAGHVAGIRPTVVDRRPLVGQHPTQKRLFCLNGLGSRGVLIAPYVSKQLFAHVEKMHSLDSEMDISRFTEKYFPN